MDKFPSIESLKNLCVSVNKLSSLYLVPRPIIEYKGTVKIHGTNAGVGYKNGQIFTQSRNNIITPDKDNLGFAKFVYDNIEQWSFLKQYKDIIVYGEWCGQGIQSGCAIHQLTRRYIIFDIFIDGKPINIDEFEKINIENVFVITNFTQYQTQVDFNNPNLVIDYLTNVTNDVEKECPVGKAFGVSGIGEGIVWRPINVPHPYDQYNMMFKTKGEKHKEVKEKTLITVDVELAKSVEDWVDNVLTENRLEKGIAYLIECNHDLTVQSLGKFLQWINKDVMAEQNSLPDTKLVNKFVTNKAKTWFLNKYK